MNSTTKTVLLIAFAIVAVMLLFGGGMMGNGVMSGGGMMGNNMMGGTHWMGLPALVMVGIGALLVWVLFGQKK